jgi:hypothetical protein
MSKNILKKNPLQPEAVRGFLIYIEVHRIAPAGS